MTTLRLPGESCSERPSISTLPPTAKLTSWSATGQMPVPPATAASRSGSACRRSPSCIGHARRAAAQSHDQAVHQDRERSEEHTSELQSLMRISYAVFCLKKKKKNTDHTYI